MNHKNSSDKNPFAGRFETSDEKKNYVLHLFSSIPKHYDTMNRVMSLGLDMSWRRKSIRLADFNNNGLLLDLATGTGDMIIAARKILPGARFIGLDFCGPLMRLAQEKGIDESNGDISLLTTEPELTLIRKMLLLPEIVELIATTLEPHHLTYYAQDLATVFHSFYKQCRVVSDNEALTRARLKLVKAAKIVLGRTLTLMGMTAPERM